MLEAPTTLADSTKGSAFSRTVSARITRKYCGMNTTVMEIAAAMMPPHRLDWPWRDHDRHHDGQQQRGEGVDRVGQHDQDAVKPAADVARDQAEDDAEEDGEEHRRRRSPRRRSGPPRACGRTRRNLPRWCPRVNLPPGRRLRREISLRVGKLREAEGRQDRGQGCGEQEDQRSGPDPATSMPRCSPALMR